MNRNGANDLPLHIHDDNNGLDYTLHGDYYLPDLEVPKAPPLNHWGRMAFDMLQKQHPGRFTRMLLDEAKIHLYSSIRKLDIICVSTSRLFSTIMHNSFLVRVTS